MHGQLLQPGRHLRVLVEVMQLASESSSALLHVDGGNWAIQHFSPLKPRAADSSI